jgi:hypothetical protein
MSDFIDDGYTEETIIPAEAGTNGELIITYRPALTEQIGKLLDLSESDEKYMKQAIDMLPTLLTGWTLKKSGGEVVKIDRANVARVRRQLLVKIIDCVFFKSDVGVALKN